MQTSPSVTNLWDAFMGCKQAHQLGYFWPNNYMILLILSMELGASPKMRLAATLK